MKTVPAGRSTKVPPFQSTNRAPRKVATLTAAVLLTVTGTVLAASPAQAAASGPAHCYQWPLEHIAAVYTAPGNVYFTSQIMVTNGSPCHDVNARSVTAGGKATCRTVRVRWDSERGLSTGPWTRVCAGWRVLWNNAHEGDLFVVDVQGPPATVGIRS